jgi:hypothetical protein
MITYILIAIGSLFALIGVILFVKRIGSKTSSKIKFLGLEFESTGSSLIIFLVGAAIIAFGAGIHNNPGKPVEVVTTNDKKKEENTNNKPENQPENNNPQDPINTNAAPLKEFTLTAGQQQVFNDLKLTFTLNNQLWNETTKAVTIRIWRQITQPLSDTAYLDPAGGQPGAVNQLFQIDHITPLSIPDVGEYKLIVSNPVINNNGVASVQVKMFNN